MMFTDRPARTRPIAAQRSYIFVLLALGMRSISASTDSQAPDLATFKWQMEPRFGATQPGVQRVTSAELPGVKDERRYDITVYDTSACYAHPESFLHGANCPQRPWVVNFTAPAKSGLTTSWSVQDGECDTLSEPHIRCSFTRLGRYRVTLTVTASDQRVSRSTQEIELKDHVIVALGDSVASGEGVPDVYREKMGSLDIGIQVPVYADPIWADRRCHRSARSGFARAALELEQSDPHSSVTFIHLACSGAGLTDGVLGKDAGQEPQMFRCSQHVSGPNACTGRAQPHVCTFGVCVKMMRPQIDQLAALLCAESLSFNGEGKIKRSCPPHKARRIDALMVSVGANDIGFSNIVRACMVFQDCQRRGVTHRAWPPEINDLARTLARIDNKLRALPSKYRDLAVALKAKLLVAPEAVLLTETFDPTRDRDGSNCNRDGGDAEAIARSEKGEYLPPVMDAFDPILDFDGLTAAEYSWARSNVIKPLNEQIGQAAARHGWSKVGGIYADFLGHGLCATDNWVAGLDRSFEVQGDYEGTLHPNRTGHDAYRKHLSEALRALLPVNDRPEAPVTLSHSNE